MDRDLQIQLLSNAESRMRSNAATWMKDPRVQETLRKNRENAKRLREIDIKQSRVKAG